MTDLVLSISFLSLFFFTLMHFHVSPVSPSALETGSRLPEDLESHPSIHYHYLTELPRVSEKLPRILYYLYAPIKAVVLAIQLFTVAMFQVAAPEVYVVQV